MNSKTTPQYRNAGMSKEAIQVSLADHLIYSSSKYHRLHGARPSGRTLDGNHAALL